MGAKAISHDSVFCADPEPEKALDKPHSSPEPQRSRSLKRSPISRTLPRASGSSALGGLSGSGDHYSSSSGAWASSSKFTEIQSLRSRRLSISPLIIRSEKVSQDLENLFASDRTPNSSRRRSSHDSTSRKSFSELSSDPELSQSSESSSQQPSGFSTPATSQGCLDSSAAKYKIALNPRKQKKKTSFSSVKGKQEEQLYSVPSKEKTTTKIKQVEQKEQRLDNTDKTSSWKADISMEPTWIAMVKQRQRGFGSHFPKKSRARSEIRAETKEPRYETKYDPEMELLSKESESVTDVTAKMTFLSTISRHEMPQSRQFIKSVAFDDQTMLQPYTRERETRRSSSLPPRFIQPQEPEWFLMAKKKAQAWSQMADLMQ